jgi:integrase
MQVSRITKRIVDWAEPQPAEYFIWDTGLPGFGVRVQPSGAMSYVVKYRAGSGRAAPTRRMTISGTQKLAPEEARKIAQKALGLVAHGSDPAAQRAAEKRAETLAEAAERFLVEHGEAKKKPSTAQSYRDLLERLVLPELGKRKANKVTQADVLKLQLKLRAHPAQANRAIRVLSSFYSWAATVRVVPQGYNPCARIEHFKEGKRERFLSSKELGAIGEAIREAETIGLPYVVNEASPRAKHAPKPDKRRTVIGSHAAAALRLLILTGARLREILNLKWDHVDLERGLLLLPDSKTGQKTIVLNAPAMAVLNGLPRVGAFVIGGAKMGQRDEAPRADLKKPWRAVARRAGLVGVRLHDLRHTHASVGVGSGLGLPIIGKLLGHTQPATTARYAHLDADPVRKASEHIGSRLAKALGDAPTDKDNVREMKRGTR